MPVDTGVNTTQTVEFSTATMDGWSMVSTPLALAEKGLVSTPLALAEKGLGTGKVIGATATQEQLHSLEAIRRLLLRVEAARATSWLWPGNARRVGHAASSARARDTAPPLKKITLPMTWRRRGARGVHLQALFR